MSRRYLTLAEAKSALARGKEIELFLGGFEKESRQCIRWASFSGSASAVTGKIWESYDEGSEEYLDLYSFSPASGEWDEPAKEIQSTSLEAALELLSISDLKLVNSGIVQDEYATYLDSNT